MLKIIPEILIIFIPLVLQADPEEQTAKDLASVMFETATMRSGYVVPDTAAFAERVERMLRLSLDIPLDAKVTNSPKLMAFQVLYIVFSAF